VCAGGGCASGPPLSCDDGTPCTTDACNPVGGCTHAFQDLDEDTVCDSLANCPETPNSGQQNADGDVRGDACDCSPGNPALWSVPGDPGDFLAQGDAPVHLSWSAVTDLGGTQPIVYDVLRTLNKGNWTEQDASAVCVATGLTSSPASDATANPLIGLSYYYLVRSRNGCGVNPGNSTGGPPRPTRACP